MAIPKDIRDKIAEIDYQFETIEYLLEYGRLRETLPIIHHTVKKIEQLNRFKAVQEHEEAAGILKNFKQEEHQPGTSHEDILEKIAGLKSGFLDIPQTQLEEFNYEKFAAKLKKSFYLLKYAVAKAHETRLEKNIRKFFSWTLIAAVAVIGLSLIYRQIISRGWGLKAEFYTGENFEQKVLEGVSPKIDFINRYQMNRHLPDDSFSIKWTGYLKAPESGYYIFTAIVDDGILLEVNGQALIYEWHGNDSASFSATMYLAKGTHPVTLSYYEGAGGERLQLYWEYGQKKREIIPQKYFRLKADA